MTARILAGLRAAGWTAGAVLFAVLLSSTFHLDDGSPWAPVLFFALAALTAARPLTGIVIAGAATPVAWYGLRSVWNAQVSWPEVLVCGVALGWCARRAMSREAGLPPALAAPSLLLAAIVIASGCATIAVARVPLGPAFPAALMEQVTRTYFVDLRSFEGLHAAMLLLEGLVLFAAAAVVTRADARRSLALPAAVAAGSACAAAATVWHIAARAMRQADPWVTLARDLATVRYNVHYADLNAAGSYFVMTALVAGTLALVSARLRRRLLVLCAMLAAAGLWISGSRTAMLAGIAAIAGALILRRIRQSGAPVGALLLGAAAVVLLALVALYMPLRGNQHSSAAAVEVRLGMAEAGARMIAAHPGFGIGVGQFPERADEFVTPQLLALFPPAAHENAHNNFIQVAAELGIPGLIAFVWLLASALVVAQRGAWNNIARTGLVVAAVAFLLTCLGGHPLLIREVAFPFWILLGAAAGAGSVGVAQRSPGAGRAAVVVVLLAIALTTPGRVEALLGETDLEHIGVGVSSWETSSEGIRYREAAAGDATLFVPANTAVRFSVKLLGDVPSALEVRLDGRVADIVSLPPDMWVELTLPARSQRTDVRYSKLELRLLKGAGADRIWITKVQPVH